MIFGTQKYYVLGTYIRISKSQKVTIQFIAESLQN